MVNHDGGEEVLASARSLLADLGEEDRLILVDNGSGDGSGERVAAGRNRVILLSHPENRPFAAACNRGVRWALKAGFAAVGLVNPDVRVETGMTDQLFRRLRAGSGRGVGAVSPVILYEEPPDRIWYAGSRIWWPLGWITHRGQGRDRKLAGLFGGRTAGLTGCCWLAGAEAWRRVGPLDDAYGMYAEDIDWSVRARRKGFRLEVVPHAFLVHRLSQSSGGGRSGFKMTYRTLAGRLFFRRWTPRWWRPVQVVLGPAADFAYWVMLRAKGEHEAAAAFREARRREPGERVPWPPEE